MNKPFMSRRGGRHQIPAHVPSNRTCSERHGAWSSGFGPSRHFGSSTRGGLADLVRGCETRVLGEIYEVDVPRLANLDRCLGHPRIYRQTSIELDVHSETEDQLADSYMKAQVTRNKARTPVRNVRLVAYLNVRAKIAVRGPIYMVKVLERKATTMTCDIST